MKRFFVVCILFTISMELDANSKLESSIIGLISEHARESEVCKSYKNNMLVKQSDVRKFRNLYLNDKLKFKHLGYMNSLDVAAIANDEEGIVNLLEDGVRPSLSLGIWLVRYSSKDALEKALSSGLNPNISESGMQSALMEAAINGLIEEARLLVEYGADINYTSDNGMSSLSWALACKHVDIVEFLISIGANISDRDKNYAKKYGIHLDEMASDK